MFFYFMVFKDYQSKLDIINNQHISMLCETTGLRESTKCRFNQK